MKKTFNLTSYFYDNWLVNILLYIDEIFKEKSVRWNKNIDEILDNFQNFQIINRSLEKIEYKFNYKQKSVSLILYPSKLDIEINDTNNNLLTSFLEDIFKIVLHLTWTVYWTENKEWKLDLETKKFEYSSKIDIKWKWSWNDILHPKKKFFKSVFEINDFKDIIKDFYSSLSEKEKDQFRNKKWIFKNIEKSGIYIDEPKNFRWIKVELQYKGNIRYIYVEKILIKFTRSQFIEEYLKYMFWKEKIKVDSKVQPFEDWQNKFEDLLQNKKVISKEDFLIWQIWQKWKKFFSGNYYFYLYVPNLIKLYWLKKILNIPDTIDENTETNITTDRIWWYIFPDEENFQLLKFIIFLYFILDEKNKIEKFLFKNPSIIIYKEGDLKETLLIFNKINLLFKLFDKWNIFKSDSFKSLINYIYNVVNNYYWKSKNIQKFEKNWSKNIPEFRRIWYKILNLKPFANDIAELQNKNLTLKSNKRQYLKKEFFVLYSNFLEMINQYKSIHQISKEAADKIWYFLAKSEKWCEDILFKLRNVKNKSQLLWWLSQIMFLVLKEPEKQMKWTYDAISNLLENINDNNFEEVKSYLTIYSIQKYLSVKKASSEN